MATRKITASVGEAPSTQPDKVDATRKVLQVISKRDGFRRAGREWHGTTNVQAQDLTGKQRAQLEAEPMLVVQELNVPAGPTDELVNSHDGGSEASNAVVGEGNADGATGQD